MINGYINKAHDVVAKFVFDCLYEGERKYHHIHVRDFSGHDVRHALQCYGWVKADLLNEIAKLKARIAELEKESAGV